MTVNITVVTCNRLELTRQCLESLFAKTGGEYVVHVVDNHSTDGTREYLAQIAARHARARVIQLDYNAGVMVAANLGWSLLEAEYYLKIDNDVRIRDENWLNKLVALAAASPELGMIGYRLCDWPHEYTALTLSGGAPFISSNTCNGGCVLIPRRTHRALGFWNEDYGKYGFDDTDYSTRAILKGYLVGYPDMNCTEVEHLGHDPARRNENLEKSKKEIIRREYQGERLFVLNQFLFKEGIRPLYVERRYLPELVNGRYKFKLNPAYSAIAKLQNELMHKFEYEGSDSQIKLDLSRLKNG